MQKSLPERLDFVDLESAIQDSRRMASITSNLLEEIFESTETSPTYYVSPTQAENILFSAFHTEKLLESLVKQFEDALHAYHAARKGGAE